jgi:hypothetical protein
MSEISWALTIDTERLILRPQQPSDYETWYAGFSGRLPKQHQYDDGLVSLAHCDRQWFADLCQRHQQQALTDQVFVLWYFFSSNRSVSGKHRSVNDSPPRTSVGNFRIRNSQPTLEARFRQGSRSSDINCWI